MQQCLPLAVLKPETFKAQIYREMLEVVATVLTACGIETFLMEASTLESSNVATVLTACGIETGSFPAV